MKTKFKIKNRFLSLLLALTLVFSMIPITSMTASATVTIPESVWTDYAATSFAGGDGSENSPYEIATAEQLALLASDVNSGDTTRSHDKDCFILTADIDLSAHRWVPIAYSIAGVGRSFSNATFDGNNKTITGLYVDESQSGNQATCAGLFGELKIKSVKNLTIKDAFVKASENSSNSSSCAGILAGLSTQTASYAAPTVENCHVSGTVEGYGYVGGLIGQASYTTIKNCTAECTITAGWSVGGFVGITFISDIQKCLAKSTVTAWDWNTGGFVGYNQQTTVKNCAALGTVRNTLSNTNAFSKAGGFVGTNAGGTISNCHTAAKVTISNSSSKTGGFIGFAGPGNPEYYVDYGTTEKCSYDVQNNTNAPAIGNIDSNAAGTNDITGADTNTVLTNICKDYYGNTEHKFDGTDASVCSDCGYQLSYWTDEGNYDISWYEGHESDYSYEISDAADLAGLAVLVNGLNGHTAVDFSYSIASIPVKFPKTITLKGDIDLSGKLWTPIGTKTNSFMGTFDGNGKTVTNMTVIVNTSFAGLFGNVGESGNSAGLQIYGLKVTSSSVTATGDSAMYIAGIVGNLTSGVLRDCSYSGTVSAEGQFVGGVIGVSYSSTVKNCVNYATVTATGSQARQVGGVVGDSMGWVENCANFGNVTGYSCVGGISGKVSSGSLENCYNVGSITATNTNEIAGAIVGYVLPPTYGVSSIDNCYFLDGTATEALGSAQQQFKTTMYSASETDFTSGKVAYSLNPIDDKNVTTYNFYQNLDNGKTVDTYPLPDSTHGKVYKYTVYAQCDKGDTTPVVKYSNTSTPDVVPKHVYEYSANGNVITETCKNCNLHTETATVSIDSSATLDYTGNAITPATVTYSDGWAGEKPNVSYENNTNAGTDTAKAYVEISGQRAVSKFSIAKAQNTWTTKPSISGWTYGQSASTTSAAAKFGTVVVTYSGYTNSDSKYDDSEAPKSAGAYEAIFKVQETDNYTGLEERVSFKITQADQTAPSGLVYKAETIDQKADGYIKNLTTEMEYRKNDEKTYISISDNELTNLADGTYYIRYKEDSNHFASPDTKVVLSNDTKLKVTVPTTQVGYTLTVDKTELVWQENVTLTFTLKEGYSRLTDYFAVKVNGSPITLDDNGKYTVPSAESDIVITVEGVADITAPTAEIKLGENKWNKFWNSVTFGLFFKETQKVTITAEDKGSGVDKVYYYLSTTEMSLQDIERSGIENWTEYTGAFNINPQDEYIIYVVVSDNSGNLVVVSSDKKIIVDSIAPTITGIANGETHYGDTTFTVTDSHIATVKVDDTEVALTDDGRYTITADGKKHAVVATDEAGNITAIKITIITIASLDDTIENITTDNVKSSDKKAIEDVQSLVNGLIAGGKDFTDAEDTELANIKANTEALLNKIASVSAEMSDLDSSVKAYDINKVKSDDKAAINALITRIDTLLNGNSLTADEKEAMTALKTTAHGLVKRIEDTASKVSELTEDVNAYDKDKVTSEDKQDITDLIADIDKLLEEDNLNDSEKEELGNVKDTATALVERIEEAIGSTETDNTDKVKDITSDNVETKDKSDLEKAKDDLEKALEDYKDNLTDDEKKDIQDEIDRIEKALDVIDRVEKVEDFINKLPENIAKSDADAIKKADEAYNALSKYEQSILDKNIKKKLDNAKSALEALNKATNSPATGDNGNIWMWFALLFVSGGGLLGATAYRRKRKETEN